MDEKSHPYQSNTKTTLSHYSLWKEWPSTEPVTINNQTTKKNAKKWNFTSPFKKSSKINSIGSQQFLIYQCKVVYATCYSFYKAFILSPVYRLLWFSLVLSALNMFLPKICVSRRKFTTWMPDFRKNHSEILQRVSEKSELDIWLLKKTIWNAVIIWVKWLRCWI